MDFHIKIEISIFFYLKLLGGEGMKAKQASGGGLFKKIIRIIRTYAQVVLVFLAFTIMVVLSCVFMINMEFQHLRKEAKMTLSNAQIHIAANLQESENYPDANIDDALRKYVVDLQITEGGYGMLLSKELNIVAHPFSKFLGASLHNSNIPISIFEDELMRGQEIFERKIVNYAGIKEVMFFKQLENGWYLGAAAPEDKYYRNAIKIAEILSVIAFALALLLGIILIRIIRMRDRAETQAKNANRAKSIFLARMSHEIRTPMNAILGVTEIELQKEAIEPAMREAFTMIYNSSNLLLGIINNILDLSKIESGKMEIVSVKYELANLINDVVQLNVMRNSKRIELEVYVDENLPAQLIGDEIRIRQILNNLLSNAFKYTGEGRINFSISFEDGMDNSEAVIIFGVSDTGDGMTKEQADNLFAEYTRFNLETNRYIQGSGLGMNITQHLLQMMNGRISVESEVNKGTAFIVHLPQKKAGFVPIGKELAEKLMQLRLLDTAKIRSAQFVYEHMPYGKILIVDDVESNLYVARGLMAPYGLSIEVCSSGFKAIENLEEGKVYDIIFMDHMMPEMDGIETTKKIREMGYAQPIVALTADVLVGNSRRFLENGFDDFVSKPIDVRQLNTVLNKFVRKNTLNAIADTELNPELLLMSTADAKNILPFLEFTLKNIESVSNSDLHLFAIKTHALKSVLANVGEIVLSQTAYALEMAGKERNKNTIKRKTQGLIDSVKAFIERNEAKLDKKKAGIDEDPAYLCEQLEIIIGACENYDVKAIDSAIENLKKKSWSKETKEAIDKIYMCLLSSDFDEVATVASEFRPSA